MNLKNVHPEWGTIIQFRSPDEFFEFSPEYWRTLIYARGVIFFKKLKFTPEQYAEFGMYFGKPWIAADYSYSGEKVELVQTRHGGITISPINNTTKKLGMRDMPWHADIPNRRYKPFPFRSLWIVSNPNPEVSGRTAWLNIEEGMKYLTPEMKELLPRVRIVQQSWYMPDTDIQEFDLLKIHPITGRQSLRLNYYNWEDTKDAWICGVKIDGVLQKDCLLVREWLHYLEKLPQLTYTHVWDDYDISIYDNWPFVHNRSELLFDSEIDTRKFYRLNIDHLDETEWDAHKAKYF
jgi:alpha-ketoglutarate-dependent taurine dioxygenase